MHKLSKYAEHLEHHPEKEKEFVEITCEAMEKFKKACPEEYHAAIYKMHVLFHGPHFDECLAKKAVAEMHNVDGTVGEHWTYDQVYNVAVQHNIKCVPDLYYAINMLYSDLVEVMGNDPSTYIKIAKALYWTDPDMPEGKLFLQWCAMHKE